MVLARITYKKLLVPFFKPLRARQEVSHAKSFLATFNQKAKI
jgi:hypothetical protein